MNKPIFVTQSSMPTLNEYVDEIRDIWNTRWLTNNGEKHQQLEHMLKKYLDCKNIILFTNGHLALEYIIEAMELTGEVITTPFTFASTTHAIVRNHLTPIFCDINRDNFTIDADKIESLITDKTSAILPVHVYGNICDIDKIKQIADKYNLKVIYDAAHTFGIKQNGYSVVNYGDASILSFHATKVFNTIEGGAVCFNDTLLTQKLNSLKNFGITDANSVKYVGGNAKMNEFQAAMGLCNLRHVDEHIAKRKVIAEQYYALLGGIDGIVIRKPFSNLHSNYAYMPVVFDGYKYSRDEIYEKLKQKAVFARKYFYPLTSSCECYCGKFNSINTPVAKYIADRVLTLPLYSDLPLEAVHKICRTILC